MLPLRSDFAWWWSRGGGVLLGARAAIPPYATAEDREAATRPRTLDRNAALAAKLLLSTARVRPGADVALAGMLGLAHHAIEAAGAARELNPVLGASWSGCAARGEDLARCIEQTRAALSALLDSAAVTNGSASLLRGAAGVVALAEGAEGPETAEREAREAREGEDAGAEDGDGDVGSEGGWGVGPED